MFDYMSNVRYTWYIYMYEPKMQFRIWYTPGVTHLCLQVAPLETCLVEVLQNMYVHIHMCWYCDRQSDGAARVLSKYFFHYWYELIINALKQLQAYVQFLNEHCL